jgi:hypothetical protein
VLIIGVAILALLGTVAWAASGSSFQVSGPQHVATGQQVQLRFGGHAAEGVRRLVVWFDKQACADRAKVESGRSWLFSPSVLQVRGNFSARLTIEHSARGTHVVCAYLEQHRTRVTKARASWRYVTS